MKALIPAVLIAAVLSAAPAHAQVTTYASCEALSSVFPSGVAKSPAKARKAVREGLSRPASSKRAQRVYRANASRLDRDGDGVACEN